MTDLITRLEEAEYLQEALEFQAQIADAEGKITTASVCREAAAHIAMLEGEGAVLATVIRENLLGVRPDDQAVALEDDDWRLILASLERFGASARPRR